MTDNTGHNEQYRPVQNAFFEQFPTGEQERIKHLWKLSSQAAPTPPEVTDEETERRLSEVHAQIAGSNRSSSKWRWIAAAASIILVFGLGYLLVPQSVTVPYGEMTSVELPDGSSVQLNSGSEVQYNRLFSYTNRTIELDGEAFFSVESGEHPFIVHASRAMVQVTGTEFNVRSWNEDPEKETEVSVSEGNVQFYPEDQPEKSVTIRPGQLSRFEVNLDRPTPPEAVSVDRVASWRDHNLLFNKKTLAAIFRELERRFDTNIRLEDQSVAKETLTTYYYKEPLILESILDDICRIKGLHYAKTADGYRVY